jgi:peptidoglycan/LPS O-acetylase OafA/YrhL
MMDDGKSGGVPRAGDGTPEQANGDAAADSVTEEREKRGKIHFPGLNGLRFFAAFSVLLYHVEIMKRVAGMPNRIHVPFWNGMGPYGVICFFCLSGFLITYLLLEETKRTGTIRIRKFYLRRILRIWPLYYLIVALGFLLLPLTSDLLTYPRQGNRFREIALYLVFLPNLGWGTPLLGPLWSVGVEEQFYLLWPVLMRTLRGRAVIGILGVLVVMVSARYALPRLAIEASSGSHPSNTWRIALDVVWTLKLECMAMGALAAYWLHGGFHKILRILYHPLVQLAALGVIFVSLWQGRNYEEFNNAIWGSAFAVLILNLASNSKSLLRLENRALDYLGRISFGIYVYHSFAIFGALMLLRNFMPTQGVLFNSLLYCLSIGATLLLAAASYRYYESPFLRLKKRHMVIESGTIP